MKRLAVLSGAGVSKESGINTFRDSGGLWEQYPVEDVASIEGWHRNPGLVLDFYNARRRDIKGKEPNEAHRIIAELEEDFTDIIHLHGEITKARGEHSLLPVYDIGYSDIHLGDKDNRGEQLRPHIVWFGEPVPMIEKAAEVVSRCDILLVIGTSLAVYPAAGLRRSGRLHPRRSTGLPHRPQPHLPALQPLHPDTGRSHLRHAPLPRPDTQLSRLNLITKRGYATTHPLSSI